MADGGRNTHIMPTNPHRDMGRLSVQFGTSVAWG